MNYTRPVLVGAAALLAAGLTAAPAASSRITSVAHLHVSIQHAVALAAVSAETLGTGPAGQANA